MPLSARGRGLRGRKQGKGEANDARSFRSASGQQQHVNRTKDDVHIAV